MCHTHGRTFVWDDNRFRKINVLGISLGKTFDHRREVRSGICKNIVNADRFHPTEQSPSGCDGYSLFNPAFRRQCIVIDNGRCSLAHEESSKSSMAV